MRLFVLNWKKQFELKKKKRFRIKRNCLKLFYFQNQLKGVMSCLNSEGKNWAKIYIGEDMKGDIGRELEITYTTTFHTTIIGWHAGVY